MKSVPVQPIFISQPCGEEYSTMLSAPGGKYCDTCKNLVTDFTGWEHDEIISYLRSRGTERICGWFGNEQLMQNKYQRWLIRMKVFIVACFGFLGSNEDVNAQVDSNSQPAHEPKVVSDSVVLLVRGEVKCDNKYVKGAKVIAMNSEGDTLASCDVADGKFEMHVPVAYPKQEFTIIASAPGYKLYTLKNYVNTSGHVIAIQLEKRGRRNNRMKRPPCTTIGCPSF